MDTIIRIVIVYGLIYLGLRLMGKREFGQLSPMELVSLLLIPELVGSPILADDVSVTNGLIAVASLLLLVYLVSHASHLSPRVQSVLEGTPTVLVHDGRLIEQNLNRERVTPDDVLAEVRRAGYERLDQVRWAVLEGDGKISVVPVEGGRRHPTGETSMT